MKRFSLKAERKKGRKKNTRGKRKYQGERGTFRDKGEHRRKRNIWGKGEYQGDTES